MKKIIAPVLLLLSVPISAFGTMFHGTITETVTSTGGPDVFSPFYYVGETFHGFYEYDSTTIDGSFFTQGVIENDGFPPDTNESLGGLMYILDPWFGPQADPGLGTNVYGELDVSGGQISAFTWQLDNNGVYSIFSAGGFSSLGYDEQNPTILPVVDVTGSVFFSNPVPDSTPTIWAAALGAVACLGFCSKRQRLLGIGNPTKTRLGAGAPFCSASFPVFADTFRGSVKRRGH
jgi:hypothetical protein